MFEHDYLMRMFMQLFKAIARSMERNREERNPGLSAMMLEDAVDGATNIDGGVLLSLTPESMAGMLEVSGTDPRVAEYVGRTLHLESEYLVQAGKDELAALRESQARALAAHYGFSLDDDLGPEEAMEAFLHEQRRRLQGSLSDEEDGEMPFADAAEAPQRPFFEDSRL